MNDISYCIIQATAIWRHKDIAGSIKEMKRIRAGRSSNIGTIQSKIKNLKGKRHKIIQLLKSKEI